MKSIDYSNFVIKICENKPDDWDYAHRFMITVRNPQAAHPLDQDIEYSHSVHILAYPIGDPPIHIVTVSKNRYYDDEFYIRDYDPLFDGAVEKGYKLCLELLIETKKEFPRAKLENKTTRTF